MSDGTDQPPSKKLKLENAQDLEKEIDFSEDLKFTVSEEKYQNFVNPEELKKLRELVLDEVKSNDEDSSDGDSESSEEDEIEKMLDENLPEDFKAKDKRYMIRQKIILEEKGINHFEVLPLDWMMVRHYSGMPIYMHRLTRVCTLSKPYFLGKGSKRHDIPLSAIPCFAYRRALEEEEKDNINKIDKSDEDNGDNEIQINQGQSPFKANKTDATENSTAPNSNTELPLNVQPVVLPGGIVMPPPRVETINTSWKTQHLTSDQVTEYCKSLFKFKTVNSLFFKRWADRRRYIKDCKTLQYPTLPEGTKQLITIPATPDGQDNGDLNV